MMRSMRGLTLIELIMVIVVISVAATFFATSFVELSRGLGVDENAQTAAQLAQACSEHILARRRGTGGYASVASGMCTGIPALAGFGSYTVADTVAAYAGSACPPSATCEQVTVTVTLGVTTPAQTTLLLVNY
jgi:prepilin-type N-terminal cleavage/methylation domain-containing protein